MAIVTENEHEQPERAERLRSIATTAERLGISRFTVRRKIKAGVLKSVRVGRRVLVPNSAIENVIKNGCAK
jgi:excisionase family DNA binding protein